jgi:hypothetical protein
LPPAASLPWVASFPFINKWRNPDKGGAFDGNAAIDHLNDRAEYLNGVLKDAIENPIKTRITPRFAQSRLLLFTWHGTPTRTGADIS